MPKIDKIEYAKRLFAIQGWIIDGVPAGLICRQIINSGWTTAKKDIDKQRSAERMLKAARDQWTEIPEAEINQKRKIRIAKLEQKQRSMKAEYLGTPAGLNAWAKLEKMIIELEGSRAETSLKLKRDIDNPLVDLSKLPIVFK